MLAIYRLEGNSYEIGKAHGRLIQDNYEECIRSLFYSEFYTLIKKKFPRSLLVTISNLFTAVELNRRIKSTNEALTYIRGVLSNENVNNTMISTVLLTEILSADRRGVTGTFGCSGLIKKIAEESWIIGKNFDFQFPLKKYQSILVRKQRDKISYVSASPLLMLFGGQFCMNSFGLVISYNYSYSRKGYYVGGLPVSYLVHDLISNARCVSEVINNIKKKTYPVGHGASLAVSDEQGGVIIEVFGEEVAFLKETSSLMNTNHFQTDQMSVHNFDYDVRFSIKHKELYNIRCTESTNIRLKKMKQCFTEIRNVDDLIVLLSDQNNECGLNNIFQTHQFWGTICSCIGFPKQKEFLYFDDIRTKSYTRIKVNDVLT